MQHIPQASGEVGKNVSTCLPLFGYNAVKLNLIGQLRVVVSIDGTGQTPFSWVQKNKLCLEKLIARNG